MLKITKCTDPLKWYSRFIGSYVPYITLESGRLPEYRSREPAGHINFVAVDDAEIVILNKEEKVIYYAE